MIEQEPDMDEQDHVEHEPAQVIVNEPDPQNPVVEEPVVGQMEHAIPMLHEVDVYAVNDVVLAEDLAGMQVFLNGKCLPKSMQYRYRPL